MHSLTSASSQVVSVIQSHVLAESRMCPLDEIRGTCGCFLYLLLLEIAYVWRRVGGGCLLDAEPVIKAAFFVRQVLQHVHELLGVFKLTPLPDRLEPP